MTSLKIAAVSVAILALAGCETMGGDSMGYGSKAKMEAPAGVSVMDCFTAGGLVDNSGDKQMCTMKDGSSKPIM